MSKLKIIILISLSLILLTPKTSQAYIGPGMALGSIMAVFAFIGAILIALFAIFFYPIKKLYKKFKSKEKKAN